MDRARIVYDIFGTLAVVGGVLFAVGVADRSYLMSDDAVHGFSWAGLALVAVGLSVTFTAKFYMEREAMESIADFLVCGSFFALVVSMLAFNIQDHDAYNVTYPCAGSSRSTILEGPAIMEIGSAGMPALDTVAAFSFFVVVSICLTRMTMETEGTINIVGTSGEREAKSIAGVFSAIAGILLLTAAVLVVIISVKIDADSPFDASVRGDSGLQDDIRDARMNIYGVTLGAILAIGAAFGLSHEKDEEGGFKGMIEKLHFGLTWVFLAMTLMGSITLLNATRQFWKDYGPGASFAPDLLCKSDSQQDVVALGNTTFAFYLPLAITMAWRACRPQQV